MGYAHRKHISPFQGHFSDRKRTGKCYIISETPLKILQSELHPVISFLVAKIYCLNIMTLTELKKSIREKIDKSDDPDYLDI